MILTLTVSGSRLIRNRPPQFSISLSHYVSGSSADRAPEPVPVLQEVEEERAADYHRYPATFATWS
jgi:hypothetical protein